VPEEHAQARAALIERFVMQGVTAGIAFGSLVTQTLAELRKAAAQNGGMAPRRSEIEEAVRRAEEQLRSEMATGSQRDRAASYHRLLNVAQKLYLLHAGASDVRTIAMLATRIMAVEARLATMAGWDEPERVHVEVTGPSDRLRQAMEGFDDAEYERFAAEELERERVIEAARTVLALPAPGHENDGEAQGERWAKNHEGGR